MAKTPRNSLCPCGSGKKYKKCCGGVVQTPTLDDKILEAGLLGLEYEKESRDRSFQVLTTLKGHADLSDDQKFNLNMQIIQTLQRKGDHRQALTLLDQLSTNRRSDHDSVKFIRAKSLERIGEIKEALCIYEEIVPRYEQEGSRQILPFVLIEFGRACSAVGQRQRAIEQWTRAADLLRGNEKEVEHYARALSNIGGALLHSADETETERGVTLLTEAIDLKAMCGDLEGLANNYSRLSLHYLSRSRFERAIAFARKDLWLARQIGDEHSLAASLGNLAIIYLRLWQLSPARSLLREALEIGERLGLPKIVAMAKNNLVAVENAGREAGRSKAVIGRAAPCACASEKTYHACCGRADFEPDTPLPSFGGISEDAADLWRQKSSDLQSFDRLSFILRDTEESRRRISWAYFVGRDGWVEGFELPDMANYHLLAAKKMAETKSQERGFEGPLAACILSVCALEAFINTVCFFLHEVMHENSCHPLLSRLPPGLLEDPMAFQRGTELTLKWNLLGRSICSSDWPDPSRWNAFTTMVSIRNELVHFKAADYEQVIPTPRLLHEILRRLPPEIEIRNIPHSWPARVLTPSFANWCVNIAESLIGDLKASYRRANGVKDSVSPDGD